MDRRYEQSKAILRAVLESPEDIVIFALDRSYCYLAFNQNHARTMERIWGASLRVGDDMLALIGRADDREKARANFDRALAGESFSLVEEYGNEQYSRRFYRDVYSPIRDEHGQVIGLTVYLTDITEQRRTELELSQYRSQLEKLVQERTAELESAHAQLLHAQKLESLGVLAGGIAHDFNNLLAVVLGRAELGLASLPVDHPARGHFAVVQETALEARTLTKQLLGYAGRGKFLVQSANLDDMVESMGPLLSGSVSKAIALELELTRGVSVDIDVAQMRQVLINLVTNAAEAIGDRPGRVTVRVRRLAPGDEVLVQAGHTRGPFPEGAACLEVEDDGCGMDERVRAKLFDPFFTTKFSGRGLGLAAVLGIVTGHEGAIVVRSRVGEGSCISVVLPRTSRAAEPLVDSMRPGATQVPHRATILVVDDEAGVCAVTAEILRMVGYEVETADGGRNALHLLERGATRVDLVLLDLTMPGMTGDETLRALKALRADLPVVLMTGYTEDEVRLRFHRGELAGFLIKPFSSDELVRTVERALGR